MTVWATIDKVSEIDRRADKIVSALASSGGSFLDFLEDLDNLKEGECLYFFREELARDTIEAKSPVGAIVAMSDWESRVSVTVSRTWTEGKGPACRSEPIPSTEP